MPNLKRYNRVLVLAAHPDDETLGCGGTIAKFSSQGCDVRLLTFTDGISAREKGDRRSQVEKVSKILGISGHVCFDFPDNRMDSVPLLDVTRKIENYIDENSFIPDVVLTHSPFCLNIDHKVVYNSTITVFRGLERFNPIKIMCYEVLSSSEWNPISNFIANCYIDISEFIQKKVMALEVYSSEMRKHPHPRSIENSLRRSSINGSQCGLISAERFMIIREVIL